MSLCRHADKLLAPPAADSDGESDGSDRVPVPNFQNSFSQAFEKALLQLDTGGAPPPQAPVEPGLCRDHPTPPCAVHHAAVFAICSQTHFHVVVFQKRKEARRRRRSRSSCSALPWSTQSRGPSSLSHLEPPSPTPLCVRALLELQALGFRSKVMLLCLFSSSVVVVQLHLDCSSLWWSNDVHEMICGAFSRVAVSQLQTGGAGESLQAAKMPPDLNPASLTSLSLIIMWISSAF